MVLIYSPNSQSFKFIQPSPQSTSRFPGWVLELPVAQKTLPSSGLLVLTSALYIPYASKDLIDRALKDPVIRSLEASGFFETLESEAFWATGGVYA